MGKSSLVATTILFLSSILVQKNLDADKNISYFVSNKDYVEWRLFQPITEQDISFLKLSVLPTTVFFHQKQTYYLLDNQIYKVAFTKKQKSTPILPKLPISTARQQEVRVRIDDTTNVFQVFFARRILDSNSITFLTPSPDYSKKQYVLFENEKIFYVGPGGSYLFVISSYKHEGNSDNWIELPKLITAVSGYESPWDSINDYRKKSSTISLLEKINSMGLNLAPRSSVILLEGNSEKGKGFVRSKFSPEIGFEFGIETGDTEHAITPLVYVNKSKNIRRIIYDSSEDQMAFAQSGHYLLVGAEYEMAHSRIINLKTGVIIKQLPPNSIYSIWIDCND